MISERTIHTLELNKIQAMLRGYAVSDLGKAAVDALSPAASLPEAERLLQETMEAESVFWRLGHTPIDVFPDIRASLRRMSAVLALSMGELLGAERCLKVSRRAREAILGGKEQGGDGLLCLLANRLTAQPSIENEIARCILSEEEMADNASPELARIRRQMKLTTEKVRDKLNQPAHLFLLLLHAAIPAGIVALQGDYGTAIIFASMTVFMLFTAGLSFWYLLGGAALMPLAFWALWTYVFGDVHRNRIRVLLNPGADPLGLEYQQNLGLKAIHAGKLFGKGLSSSDYVTVPEMHNDFIFSFIGQAFGFVGMVTVIVILACICLRIFRDSRAAKDQMGKVLCMGVFAIMFTHDVMNLGMVMKVMPVIGIPLPFFSAGGTAMLSMYLCIGLVISAYTHNQKKYRVFYDAENMN